ncbi:MAG: hydrogenase iron-sulfur subunit [Thermoplasmata archaeon]|nr:hydrogenase iron-sulfur subunit [Thermoplasmata archaeon]
MTVHDKEGIMIIFGCKHTATPILEEASGREARVHLPDFEYRELPCLGSLDSLMVLRALDEGAPSVVAVGCFQGRCRHLTGSQRAKAALGHVGDVLEEVGLDRKRIGLVLGSPIDKRAIIEQLAKFATDDGGDVE